MNIKKQSIILIVIFSLISLLIGGCSTKNPSKVATNGVIKAESQEDISDKSISTVNGEIKVHYIDVGQADSILIQQGTNSMLIDAGNNDDSDNVINYLKAQGIKKLDYVIATHPHEDHIGGMDKVVNTFDIGTLYMPKVSANTKTFKDVLGAIKVKGLSVTTPVPGTSFELGQAKCDILAPNGSDYKDINDYSIVIKITFGEKKFLFQGDAEEVSEKEILSKGFDISADVLKLGHHGSSSSSSMEYLKKVNCKFAIISCGKNNTYGHPHKETMDKLKKMGIKVYRTDEDGTIVITSDGRTISCNAKEGSYLSPSNKK